MAKFKVDDVVWSHENGFGKVIAVNEERGFVEVDYTMCGVASYTLDGRTARTFSWRALFHAEDAPKMIEATMTLRD